MNNKETLIDKILRLKNRQNEIDYFFDQYKNIRNKNSIYFQIKDNSSFVANWLKVPINDFNIIKNILEQELIQINKELDFINTVELKVQ